MPEGSYEHLRNFPTWRRDSLAIEGGILPSLADEDVEETLMVQLTMPELALYTFGLSLIERLFPELSPLCVRCSEKMADLCRAQEYLSEPGSTTGDGE